MLKIKNLALLQLFAEGGEGISGEAPAAEVQTGEDTPADAAQEETAEDAFASFVQKYGSDAKPLTEYMQKSFNQRFKPLKESEAKAQRLDAFREVVAKQYPHVKADDIDALEDAFLSDSRFYEARAMETGDDPKNLAEREKLQLKVSRLEAKEKQEKEQKEVAAKAKAFRDRLTSEEKAMKKAYPDFNLDAEMQNPKLRQMLLRGESLEVANHALHHKDIVQKMVSAAKSATVQSIESGSTRPAEGAAAAAAPSTAKVDYSTMSDEEFMQLYNSKFRT